MKKQFIIFVCVLLIGQVGVAQIKDSKGHLITSKGDIYFQGTKIGRVLDGKDVLDGQGKKIAHLEANGVLKDAEGRNLGKIGKDGASFFTSEHVLAITVRDLPDETCDVLDGKGNVIGNVHDSYKGMACVIHCFQHQMKEKPAHSRMKH